MYKHANHWWPLCFSETITSTAPTALFWGPQELAVYRDKNGDIRAVEDRCPHRRAPLSLGRITDNGHIQCGYHGWTFNGETGDISGFPNLDDDERLPKCGIKTFPTYEHQGVVYIANTESDIAPTGLNLGTTIAATFAGQATYGLAHEECVAVVLDNPDLFINILGVEILDKTYGNPKIQDGLFITERACRWNFLGESRFYLGPMRHRADFPLTIKTASTLVTGETRLTLSRPTGEVMCELQLTFSPSTRGMTSVHWHGTVDTSTWGWVSPLLGLQKLLRRKPIGLKLAINGNKLATTLPNAGEDWRLATHAEALQVINQEAVCQ